MYIKKNAPKLELLTNGNCILTEVFNVSQWNLVTIFHFPTQVTKIILSVWLSVLSFFNFLPSPPLFSTLKKGRRLRERRKKLTNVKSLVGRSWQKYVMNNSFVLYGFKKKNVIRNYENSN